MNIHKSIVVLLLTIFWSAIAYGQDCASFVGPTEVFGDQIDTTFSFPIYNADSTVMGVNQRVCQVNVHFESAYIQELQISLTSPGGEEILLVGATSGTSTASTPGSAWDISFVPLDSMTAPDIGYSGVWNNDQIWSFFTTYTGAYHPFNASDLYNYRVGSIFGEWKLRIVDGLENFGVQTRLISFSIEFCNPSGLDCKECEAEADTIVPTILNYCENDPSRRIEFSDYLTDTAFIDNLSNDFTYKTVIVQNDTVLDFRRPSPVNDTIRFGGLAPGTYEVYGMSYDKSYEADVPNPDSTFTIDSLRTMIDSLPRIFCGDITKDALTVIIDPIDTTYVTETICNGDSIVVGGMVFKETIFTQIDLVNQYDCDSIVIIDLDVISIPINVIDTILCSGDSLEFNGTYYKERTNLPFRLTSTVNGCDSVVLLDLRFHPYNFSEINEEICAGDDFLFFGNTLNTTGIYRDSTMGMNGCDSIVQLNLNVVTEFIVDTMPTLCIGDTFSIGPQKYFSSGMYTHTIPSTLGCDSTVNLSLTILDPILNDISEIICFGDSIQVGSNFYNSTGEYVDTLTSSLGCDSIVQLELIVRDENRFQYERTICFGDSLISAGKFYKSEGVHIDTLKDQFMCDSIIELDLTVRAENRIGIDDVLCFGQSAVVGDSTYSESGIFETVITDVNGCDSTVVLDLIILDQVIGVLDTSICLGDSILVGDQYLKDAGNYEIEINRQGQCDSTVMVGLDIIDPVVVDLPIRLCEGTPYSFGGAIFTEEGIYMDTVQSELTGCDSITVLDLQYDPIYVTDVPESICAGDSLFYMDVWLKETGVYDDTLRSIANCDSIVRLNLTVLSLDDPVMISETLCFGDSIFFKNNYLKLEGEYRDTLLSDKGCDSLVVLDLSFRSEQRFEESMTICLGDTFDFQNDQFYDSGTYPFMYMDQYGCDSTHVLNLSVEECPLDIKISSISPTCAGFSDGAIRIELDYGNPPYQVNVGNDDFPFATETIFNFGDSLIFENLAEDTYWFNVEYTSVNGAVRDTTFTIELTGDSGININAREMVNPSCENASDGIIEVEVSGGFEPYDYLWNDGSEELNRTGLTSGTYRLTVTDIMGCIDSFNFELMDPAPITFSIDQTPPTCAGSADAVLRFIDVEGGSGEYSYNIGSGNEMITVFDNLPSETYIISVEDSNGCMAEGLEVINDPPVFTIDAGEDFTLQNIGETQLNLTSNGLMTQINWSPAENLSCNACPDPIANINRTTTFQVTAENEVGCAAEDQIIIILDIDRTVDPAQAFTPNGDGVNDLFIVHGNSSIAEISNIEIYARSGELVWKQESFPVNDPNFGWDGTYQGEPMTSQLLGYFVEVIYKDGKTKLFKGQLTLIR